MYICIRTYIYIYIYLYAVYEREEDYKEDTVMRWRGYGEVSRYLWEATVWCALSCPLPASGSHTRIPRRLICQRATVFRRLPLYANGTPEAVRRPSPPPPPTTPPPQSGFTTRRTAVSYMRIYMAHIRSARNTYTSLYLYTNKPINVR